ncbi:hypothetical protein C2S52_012638 [Perilla frutescens var. hirtella]|nr:hypothetical protein C2S52_012638 [Perilla frutescens var. hirtella]
MVGIRHCPPTIGEVSKILLDISYEGNSTDLTPQKNLLSIIEALEKMIMEKLNHLRRTPTAKKVKGKEE